MKKIIYILLLFQLPLLAQKLNVQVSTTKPTLGVPFEILFSMNASPQDFTPPSFKEFEIIAGPNQSQNIQFINGSMSQSYSISYVLIPKKEGNITIQAAKVIINNQTIYSSSVTLEVQKGGGNNNYSAQQKNPGQPSSVNVEKEDIFVRTTINKKQCYIGEQVTLTQKIYTKVELRGVQNVKFPHLEGFWSKNQENNNNNIQLHIENIDGVNYYVGAISSQYLFPQKSGKISIPPIEMDCVIRKRTNRPPRDIFEQFFGVNAYEDKVVSLKSQAINIIVDNLPANQQADNFTGAVGTNFSFRVEINKSKVPANEAINLKISISGNGNLPLIGSPKINFPIEFETYDPKITENISTTNGVSGTKFFEYLIIPRKEGVYQLSDIAFSYFNLNTKSYTHITAPDISIEVSPPLHNNNNTAQIYQQFKQEIKNEDTDIHFIKTYPYPIYKKNDHFFNSPIHLTLMLAPYFLMLGLLGYYQYQKKEKANLSEFLQKRAHKIALKHLQIAEKKMKENNSAEFYTAIIQAIENYLTYKFKIQKSELSKDKIKESFIKKQIPEELQNKYFDVIHTCELAKYAPINTQYSFQNIYSDTKNLIIELENKIKNA